MQKYFVRSVIIIYFTEFKEEYIPEILNLEKKSYPKELVSGETELRADSKKPDFKNYSLCCFSGGKLVGYIMAYYVWKPVRAIYISDINCPNPKYLGRLLMRFFSAHNGAVFEGDFRENSYRLLCNQQKKDKGLIYISEQKFMPQYYDNGEDAHYVRFTVYAEVYLEHNWKNRFQIHLDNICHYHYENFMSYVFELVYELAKKGIDFYAEKNMKYVIHCLKENILDYYQMFDDNILYTFELYMYTKGTQGEKGIKAFEKSILKLKELGYKEGSEGNSYIYDKWNKRLTVSRVGIMSNTRYKDKLSGVRWLWKRHLLFSGDREDKLWVTYYNKYGVKHDMIKVPYLTKKNYLYYLNRVIFELKLFEKIKMCDDSEKKSLHKIIADTYFLLGSKDAPKCVNNIVERYKGSEWNYFHDWGVILNDLKSVEAILTKGAIIAILCGSYNQALRICKHVNSIKQTVLDDSLARRLYCVKEIRKTVSRIIRNHQDCMPYVKELCNSVTEYYSKKLNIPVAVREKLPEYMKRIQKYNPSITIYTLYRIFGKECLFQYILGTYSSIFTPKIVYPTFDGLCVYIKEILQKRTKKSKRLYGKLVKGDLLSAVIECGVTFQQYKEILKILKHHNIDVDETIKTLCDFKACIEPKGSPEFLTAGDATVCCMSLGTEKAITYATEEGFGIINVYYRERVIANSVIWINSPYRCLVLDNIEVHPNYIKYSKQLELCFYAAAEYLMEEQQLDSVVQGLNYNDLRLYQVDTEEHCFSKMKPLGVQTEHFYSDAKYYEIVMQKSCCLNDASNHNNEAVAA